MKQAKKKAIGPTRMKFDLLNDKVKSYGGYHFKKTNLKKISTEIRKIKIYNKKI